MNKRWKWIVSLGTVFLVVFFSGYHFLKPYYRFRFSAVEVTKVNAMTTIRKVIPGGPARFLSQDGDYIVGIGQVSLLDTDWAVYLYDTNGTLSDTTDDSYTTIDVMDEGEISDSIVKGDYVTWAVYNPQGCNSFSLKGYKISTQNLFTIDSNVCYTEYSRDGNKLVYAINGVSSSDIEYYDLSNNTSTSICTAAGDQIFPEIKGNYIAWMDFRNKQSTQADIYKYNLTTSQESVVTNTSDYECCPRLNGSQIVYLNSKSTTSELRIYDISSSTDSLITSLDVMDTLLPAGINSSYVVYNKDYNNEYNIYLYNISTATSVLVKNSSDIISSVLLGDTQIAYIIKTAPFQRYGSIHGYDIPNSTDYAIRNTGKTFEEISINENTDYVIMTSEGVDNDPDEWDVSLATLP